MVYKMIDIKKYLLEHEDIIFRMVYLLHLFVSFNTILNLNYLPKITLIILMVSAVFSFVLKAINYKKYVSDKRFLLVTMFILSYVISMIFFINLNVIGNLKCLIWLSLQMVLLYLYKSDKNKDEIIRDINILCVMSIVYVTIINCIGLYMMSEGTNVFIQALDGSVQFHGFWWGRLYGLFNDPNHAAVVTVLIILMAIYLLHKKNKVVYQIALVISIIIQFLFLIFTDSRSGLVSLILGLCVFIVFSNVNSKFSYKKLVTVILLIVLSISSISLASTLIKTTYNKLNNETVLTNLDEREIDKSNKSIEEDKNSEAVKQQIGREKDISEDISNRRFSIWKSGLEIVSHSPIVGVGGYASIVPYAKKYIPSTYLISNDYKEFDSFHNSFIDILVSQGGIGFIIFLVLFLSVILYVFKNMKYFGTDTYLLSMLLAVISSVTISGCLLSNILYINSIESYYLWCYLGYFYLLISKNKKENSNEESSNLN